MIRLNPLWLAILVAGVSALPASSKIVTVVKVTTFEDENGENAAACSLREAIKANNDLTPFGGCSIGDRYLQNTIQLQNGEYRLKADAAHGPLLATREIKIVGIDNNDYGSDNPLTNNRPKVNPPTTVIDGQNAVRIFDTTANATALVLGNLIVRNGVADRGGAILAGGSVNLDKVYIRNNRATEAGGAIYLSGVKASLNSTLSSYENNQSPVGAAIGMSCMDNLMFAARTIEFNQMAIIGNGDGANSSVIEGCGNLIVNITASTIARNQASNAPADKGGVIRLVDKVGYSSSIVFQFVTAAENGPAPVITYSNLQSLSLNNSVIAFNGGSGCLDTHASFETALAGDYNSLQGCAFDTKVSGNRNIALDGLADATLANELEALANYGGLTPNYPPKLTSKYVLDKAASGELCPEVLDQRGAPRNANMSCERGAVERRQLLAADDLRLKNAVGSNRAILANLLDNDAPSETFSGGVWSAGTLSSPDMKWPTASALLAAPAPLVRPVRKVSLIAIPGTVACSVLDSVGTVSDVIDQSVVIATTVLPVADSAKRKLQETVKTKLGVALEQLRKTTPKKDSAALIDELLAKAEKVSNADVAVKLTAAKNQLKTDKLDIDGINALQALAEELIRFENQARDTVQAEFQLALTANNSVLAKAKLEIFNDLDTKIVRSNQIRMAFISKNYPKLDEDSVNSVVALADAVIAYTTAAAMNAETTSMTLRKSLLSDLAPNVVRLGNIPATQDLLFYKSNEITPANVDLKCTYQIRDEATAGLSNVAKLTLQIVNNPPNAADDTVSLQQGASSVVIDVLANDDDKGDGVFGGLFRLADENPAKALNIQIETEPELGYITGEAEGLCPNNNSINGKKCFGGKLTYHPDNNLSPFSDQFTYSVLDRDLAGSPPATVKIINSVPADGEGGGGSFGWLSLGALGMMAFRRYQRRQVKK